MSAFIRQTCQESLTSKKKEKTEALGRLPRGKWPQDPRNFGFSGHARLNELTSGFGDVWPGTQPFQLTRPQASSRFVSKTEQFDYGYAPAIPGAKARETTLAHAFGAQAAQQTLIHHQLQRGRDG